MLRVIAVTLALLLSLLTPPVRAAMVQPPPERPIPRDTRAARVCSMMARVVAIRVLDRRTGAPVSGATITVTRSRTDERLSHATPMGSAGDYLIAQDGGIPGLTRAGEPLRVEVRLGGRRVSATYVVGLTADGCHIELREGPRTLRL